MSDLASTWASLAVGLALAITAGIGVDRAQHREERARRERQALVLGDQIRKELLVAVESVTQVAGFFAASEEVTREEFARFTRHTVERQPGLSALEWAPRVEHAERAARAQAALDEGFALWPPPEHERALFPVFYIEPELGNEAALGFDLGSEATRSAMLRAAEAGRAVCSGPIDLVQDNSGAALLAAHPIPDDHAQAGFAIGVFRMGELVAASETEEGARVARLDDVTDPDAPQALFERPRPQSPPLQSDVLHTLEVCGRRWRLQLAPAAPAHAHDLPLMTFLGVLLASGIVSALAWRDARQTGRLRRLALALERALEERKAAEAELVSSASLASLGQLTQGVSQELEAPLAEVARIGLQLQRQLRPPRNGPSTPAAREAARLLGTQSDLIQQARSTLAELLDFARSEPLEQRYFDLAHSLSSTIGILRHKAGQTRIRLESEDLPPLLGHPGRIHQVFVHIIRNALEAMPDGGDLTIRCRAVDGQVVVTVRDTGEGMSPALQRRIFEPFFSTRAEGAGLGLAISHGIVQAHGGRIEVESRLGAGTTIRVLLPVPDAVRSEERQAGGAPRHHAELLDRVTP